MVKVHNVIPNGNDGFETDFYQKGDNDGDRNRTI